MRARITMGKGAIMLLGGKPFKIGGRQRRLLRLGLCLAAVLAFEGCGETSKPVISPAADQVDAYFGGPFAVPGGSFGRSQSSFDHSANQISVSSFLTTQSTEVPTNVMSGSFTTASTGFLNITENFATTSSGVISAQNPPLTGGWAVEIPGAGALANFLTINSTSTPAIVRGAPAAMAENTACPNYPTAVSHLFVTVPNASRLNDFADWGAVGISSQGSAVTFGTQPYLIGMPMLPFFQSTGGCSMTNLGALTALPLNSFGTTSTLELIGIGSTGMLVSSYNVGGGGATPGAFGGGTGVIGMTQPTSAVDVTAVIGGQYNGFLYSPQNTVGGSYDITVLASSYGDYNATAPSCSALEASLAANNGKGAGTVPVLPSANSLYGGEFLTGTGTGAVNDPSGAGGQENCDVVIDLGAQDSDINGAFPNATIFVGSNFPPYNTTMPWKCSDTGGICAVSFPAAAIVGQLQGKYVIFVVASASSTPAAALPDNFGNRFPQSVGIYLFQK